MQALFYGIIGRPEVPEEPESGLKHEHEHEYELPKEDFETLGCPEEQTINQIHRKIKLLNEFKRYIKEANSDTIYYQTILNTTVHEYECRIFTVHTILPGIFGRLYEYRTSDHQDPDEFIKMLLEF